MYGNVGLSYIKLRIQPIIIICIICDGAPGYLLKYTSAPSLLEKSTIKIHSPTAQLPRSTAVTGIDYSLLNLEALVVIPLLNNYCTCAIVVKQLCRTGVSVQLVVLRSDNRCAMRYNEVWTTPPALIHSILFFFKRLLPSGYNSHPVGHHAATREKNSVDCVIVRGRLRITERTLGEGVTTQTNLYSAAITSSACIWFQPQGFWLLAPFLAWLHLQYGCGGVVECVHYF